MKNSVELRQERANLITEANNMLELCKTEERDFNESEQVSYNDKMESIDKLAKNIETVERQEKLNAEIASKVSTQAPSNEKEVRNFSFFKAVNDFTNGKLEGLEREMHEEAVNEARSAGRTINGLGIPSFMLESRANVTQAGSAIAPTNVLGFADAMREASVFDKVGATILTGLSANTTIPVTGASSVEWEGEVDPAADGGAQFGKVELTPTRLASYVNISKQLLLQNGAAAEQAIIRDLGRATAQKMDAAIFTTAGVAGAPDSLGELATSTFTEASYSANASIMNDFVEAETVLAEAGGLLGNLAYVAHPSLMADLKRSAQVASVTPGMQGSLINGYPTYFTNGCTKASNGASADFYFGDFSKLYMGMFGGLDIMVDPYSVAVNGQTRLVLNQYMDWGVSDGAGFVKATSLLA